MALNDLLTIAVSVITTEALLDLHYIKHILHTLKTSCYTSSTTMTKVAVWINNQDVKAIVKVTYRSGVSLSTVTLRPNTAKTVMLD